MGKKQIVLLFDNSTIHMSKELVDKATLFLSNILDKKTVEEIIKTDEDISMLSILVSLVFIKFYAPLALPKEDISEQSENIVVFTVAFIMGLLYDMSIDEINSKLMELTKNVKAYDSIEEPRKAKKNKNKNKSKKKKD